MSNDMSIGDNDWVIVLGWAMNAVLAFAGIIERLMIYSHARRIELDPDLPAALRIEARLRRESSTRRVWVKLAMALISILELAVIWDRWWYLAYDVRDVTVCLTMTVFLIWMLSWREP